MSSWVLLLAALAAFVRFACTEGDPLPPALVELVRSSSISSIQDLQLLLEPDSVDEDPDSQTSSRRHINGTSKRLPRSLAIAGPSVSAVVLEVITRNFLLPVWRCRLQYNSVHPIITRTRYLLVLKVQYVNRSPHYEKVVISVQDHVECRCQSIVLPPPPRTTAKKPQHVLQPQQPAPKTPPLKTPSKEELHRQDELKENQKRKQDGREQQRLLWQAKHVPAQTPTPASPSHSRATPATEPRVESERSQQSGGEGKESPPTQETHGTHRGEGEKEQARPRGDAYGGPHPERLCSNMTAHQSPLQRITEEERNHSKNHECHHNLSHSTAHDHSLNHNRTETTEESQLAVEESKHTQPPKMEDGQLLQLNLQEKQELVQLQSELERERAQLKEQEKLLEYHRHQQHDLHRVLTTTQRPATAALTTARLPPTRRVPSRRVPSRRRPRKHRRRISKATMRAMLM
ncbi:hypothetical protein GJAV_G00142980 [Gymnothorax javanicus]|nr:hypothetical protein GJAV_G00142980 [Gymnothorax javanicus]